MSERLDAASAVTAVAENALNLLWVGQAGLDAVVGLAARVPCHRLVHGGGAPAVAAVEELSQGSGGISPTPGAVGRPP